MAGSTDTPEPSARELADLSALADGTLDPARREEVQARIDSSPELRERYERERRVVELLQTARATDRAPAGLRARIEAERPSRRRLAGRRASYGAALAGALAVIALAVVLVLPGGTPGSPSLSQAAALSLRGMAAPPPSPDARAPAVKLGRDVEEVYFPNWSGPFGWRAVGQRVDRLNGRLAATVYYQQGAHQLAYTIVGAPALSEPKAAVTWLQGVELRTLQLHGRLVVTWRRDGRTCVLSGNGVPASEVQRLAAWEAPGLERAAS
jgi:hypothetical protein